MYIAKKPCSFGGKSFVIGDKIPEGMVDDKKAPFLIKRGIIIDADVEEKTGVVRFDIPIHAKEGDVIVSLSMDEVVEVFDVLQGSAEEAKSVIEFMESPDGLLLLEAVETRKTVQTAIKERCKVLWPDVPESDPAEDEAKGDE